MTLSAGASLGPYEILGPIGAGGMGEVYRARDRRLGRGVAVKVLPEEAASRPESLRRFEQEARAVAALDHPNILGVHDVGSHEGRPYIVTELLEGESLRERLGSGDLTAGKAVELAVQAAQGLAAAHEEGIVHRDLKPENLFLTRDGRVKILDFGLARLREVASIDPDAATASKPTSPGAWVGTVGYMPPEQVRGRPVDHRSDLFALGVVLYEMLARRSPFRRDTAADTIGATLDEHPPPLRPTGRPVSPALESIVRRCLEKRPEDRFQSAHDLALALKAVSDAVDSAAVRPVSTGRPWRKRRLFLAAGLVALALAAGGLLLWRSSRPGPVRKPSLVALPARVLGGADSAFLTDAVPDTLSTLLGSVEGLDTKAPPSSVELERLQGDSAKVAEAYRVDSLLLTTVTVQGGRLLLNVQLVDPTNRTLRWSSQYEGTLGAYNELLRQAALGVARAVKPAGSRPVTVAGPAFSSEVELALREGRHFRQRYELTQADGDFDQALTALQHAQSLNPASARLAAELAELFNSRHFATRDVTAQQQAETWAARALELDPRCGHAWGVRAWIEANRPKADPDKIVGYALEALASAPEDARVHIVLGSVAPTKSMMGATGVKAMDLDPLNINGYIWAAIGLMDTGRAVDALPILERAERLEAEPVRYWKFRALFKLGRAEEAKRAYTPGPGSELMLAILKADTATARRNALQSVAEWRKARLGSFDGANLAWIQAPLLARLGLADEALWLLQKPVEAGSSVDLDYLFLDTDLQPLRRDPRYEKVLAGSRAYAVRFLEHADRADARGELPMYLRLSLSEVRELIKRASAP
jgi:TolB-like protein